jgi:hypothetical protein
MSGHRHQFYPKAESHPVTQVPGISEKIDGLPGPGIANEAPASINRGCCRFSTFKRKEINLSHIVSISTKIRDSVAVTAACQRLGLPQPTHGTAKLYSGQATGLLVQFPGWQYPAVIDTNTGTIQYDNFGGHWGEIAQLDKFLQSYAVEKTKLEARKKGMQVSEQTLQDGSIKLHILEGGA